MAQQSNDGLHIMLVDEHRMSMGAVSWTEACERLAAYLKADKNGWSDGRPTYAEDVLTAIFTGRDHGA